MDGCERACERRPLVSQRWGIKSWAVAVAIAATATVAPALSEGHLEHAGVPGADARAARAVLGDGARLRPDGLYSVAVAGRRTLLTHGPDPAPVAGPPAKRGDKSAPQRAPVCATGRVTRFMLALPRRHPGSGTRSRRRATRRVARRARSTVRGADALLDLSSLAAGGPHADLNVLCDRRGRVALNVLRFRRLDFDSLVSMARRRGFSSPVVDHVILVRGRQPDTCGAGSFDSDGRLSYINKNNLNGGYAIVYRPCWTGEGLLHEIGHLEGAVQYAAPFSTGSGRHCWDDTDVMCYAPDGGDLHQEGTIARCARISFDCGSDTYFDPTPEPGEYLADHWNLGSRLNAYIHFGD
jgi:hypothetical protein